MRVRRTRWHRVLQMAKKSPNLPAFIDKILLQPTWGGGWGLVYSEYSVEPTYLGDNLKPRNSRPMETAIISFLDYSHSLDVAGTLLSTHAKERD